MGLSFNFVPLILTRENMYCEEETMAISIEHLVRSKTYGNRFLIALSVLVFMLFMTSEATAEEPKSFKKIHTYKKRADNYKQTYWYCEKCHYAWPDGYYTRCPNDGTPKKPSRNRPAKIAS